MLVTRGWFEKVLFKCTRILRSELKIKKRYIFFQVLRIKLLLETANLFQFTKTNYGIIVKLRPFRINPNERKQEWNSLEEVVDTYIVISVD